MIARCNGLHAAYTRAGDRPTELLADLEAALVALKFSEEDIRHIFTIVAAVMHINCMEFVPGKRKGCRYTRCGDAVPCASHFFAAWMTLKDRP